MRLMMLASGGGSTAEKVAQKVDDGTIKGVKEICLVASAPNIPALEKMARLGVRTHVIDWKALGFEAATLALLQLQSQFRAELVAQLGWLKHTPQQFLGAVRARRGEVINQHPGALDPQHGNVDFGGDGLYGDAVTASVLLYHWLLGAREGTTASSVHRVTAAYDHGDVIRSVPMPLTEMQDWHAQVGTKDLWRNEELMDILKAATEKEKKALLPIEHDNVIEVVRDYSEKRITEWPVRTEPLIPHTTYHVLAQARDTAVKLYQPWKR